MMWMIWREPSNVWSWNQKQLQLLTATLNTVTSTCMTAPSTPYYAMPREFRSGPWLRMNNWLRMYRNMVRIGLRSAYSWIASQRSVSRDYYKSEWRREYGSMLKPKSYEYWSRSMGEIGKPYQSTYLGELLNKCKISSSTCRRIY